MIRIDKLWLCTHSQDMRAGADRLLSLVVNTLGKAFAGLGKNVIQINLRAGKFNQPINLSLIRCTQCHQITVTNLTDRC